MKINMDGIDCDCTPIEFFELLKLKKENENYDSPEIADVVPQETMGLVEKEEYDDYKFPEISPLSQEGLIAFEYMIKNMISLGGGKISMFDMANIKIDNEVWNGITWRNFCTNVENVLPRIRKVMLMKNPKALRVQYLPAKDGQNYHYITYGV